MSELVEHVRPGAGDKRPGAAGSMMAVLLQLSAGLEMMIAVTQIKCSYS